MKNHAKRTINIPRRFLKSVRDETQNSSSAGARGLIQKAEDALSASLGTLFLKHHSYLFKENNGHANIVGISFSKRQKTRANLPH